MLKIDANTWYYRGFVIRRSFDGQRQNGFTAKPGGLLFGSVKEAEIQIDDLYRKHGVVEQAIRIDRQRHPGE